MSGPLLSTKLFIPRPKAGTLVRSRVSDLLDQGTSTKLTVVSAQAGFGKTTAVANWVHQRTAPGVVGSIASGTGANVVSGVPGRVVAENGPGLLSGEVTIAPGTVGRLIAVLPVVATWAWQDEHPSKRVANAAHAMRIMSASPHRRRPCGSQPDCPRPD